MFSKRTLHYYSRKLHKVNIIILIGLFVVSGAIHALSLRHNNFEMLRLRAAVFAADKQGEGVEDALNELRNYVYSHMNTDLNSGGVSIKPPIQLKHTYERLILEEKTKVAAHNKKVTEAAPAVCEARFPAGQIRARVSCVDDYIAKNTIAASDTPPKELYQFDFASPRWSPDVAGFSLLISFILGCLLIIRSLLSIFFAYELK